MFPSKYPSPFKAFLDSSPGGKYTSSSLFCIWLKVSSQQAVGRKPQKDDEVIQDTDKFRKIQSNIAL